MSNKYGWRHGRYLKSPPTGEDKDFVSTLMDTMRVAHYYGSPHVILGAFFSLRMNEKWDQEISDWKMLNFRKKALKFWGKHSIFLFVAAKPRLILYLVYCLLHPNFLSTE